MNIYLQPRVLNEKDVNKLKTSFPQIQFISDKNNNNIEAAICYPNYITKERLKNCNNLKWVQLLSAGFDTIEEMILQNTNIIFTNAKDIYSSAIAEDVICKILMINRNVKKYLKNMEEKKWHPYYQELELNGATVGIIGVGSIGKEIAKRLQPFSVKVIGYRRKYEQEPYFSEIYVGKEGLETLLKISDYVILALPLNKESRYLINSHNLKLMKSNAVLINIARGEIINQDDLIKALQNKQIRAAALDVTTPEPLPENNQLWNLDNVFITPHNSLYSPLLSKRLTELIIDNINNYMGDERLINIISPKR